MIYDYKTLLFVNNPESDSSWGFPGSPAGKEPTCSEGDPSSIPGLGRSPQQWLGYPLQYSWASLVAQMVKNLPAMQEAWVQSLGWEDSLEEGMATHSSILAWRIPTDTVPWGHKESEMTEQLSPAQMAHGFNVIYQK